MENPEPVEMETLEAEDEALQLSNSLKLDKVLRNPLVFDRISQHLSLNDFKSLHKTSKSFRAAALTNPKFLDSRHLQIYRYVGHYSNISDDYQYHLKTRIDKLIVPDAPTFPWKSITLDVDGWELNEWNCILELVKSAKILGLRTTDRNIQLRPKPIISSLTLGNLITLSNTPKLNELHLDYELFRRQNLSALFASEAVISGLQRITALKFVTFPKKFGSHGINWDMELFANNIQALTNAIAPGSLTSITLDAFYSDWFIDAELLRPIGSFLKKHENDLVHLEINIPQLIVKEASILSSINFGKLSSLTIKTKASVAKYVVSFMDRQSCPGPIDSLTLHLTGGLVKNEYCPSLKNALSRIGPQLKELSLAFQMEMPRSDHIFNMPDSDYEAGSEDDSDYAEFEAHEPEEFGEHGIGNDNEVEDPIIPHNADNDLRLWWDFLQLMKNLEIFEFFEPSHQILGKHKFTVLNILPNFPKEALNKLRTLRINGIQSGYDLMLARYRHQAVQIEGIFKELTQLEHLDFSKCKDALSDTVLEIVLTTSTRLRTLKLSHCFWLKADLPKPRDIPTPQKGKSLEVLDIKHCPRLKGQEIALMLMDDFDKLKKLVLTTRQEIDPWHLAHIVYYKPTLTEITLNHKVTEEHLINNCMRVIWGIFPMTLDKQECKAKAKSLIRRANIVKSNENYDHKNYRIQGKSVDADADSDTDYSTDTDLGDSEDDYDTEEDY